ncbi:MAG TPA: ornithine carbamoyltransferase [Solirubrobacter sp.]|nr:ornithine carbamoyltransferase [Solirubrobacter sp.]
MLDLPPSRLSYSGVLDHARAPTAEGRSAPTPWPDDLLRPGDLTCVALEELLDLAVSMKRDPSGWIGALAGRTLACFVDPPTTGEAVSVGAAANRLGMLPLIMPRAELEVASGEPIDDIARTFSSLAAALFVDAVPHRTLRRVAAAATVPVVSARSDQHRPCQVLADLLTLRERFGALEGLAIAFVGNGSDPIAHSLIEGGALAGMDVRVACPPTHRPDTMTCGGADAIAAFHGGQVTVTDDPREAVAGADAVYTAGWSYYGSSEPPPRLDAYQVHPPLMTLAQPHAVFLHCLPARRGEEVTAPVFEGRRSVVWQQVANRVPVKQALLYSLIDAPAG